MLLPDDNTLQGDLNDEDFAAKLKEDKALSTEVINCLFAMPEFEVPKDEVAHGKTMIFIKKVTTIGKLEAKKDQIMQDVLKIQLANVNITALSLMDKHSAMIRGVKSINEAVRNHASRSYWQKFFAFYSDYWINYELNIVKKAQEKKEREAAAVLLKEANEANTAAVAAAEQALASRSAAVTAKTAAVAAAAAAAASAEKAKASEELEAAAAPDAAAAAEAATTAAESVVKVDAATAKAVEAATAAAAAAEAAGEAIEAANRPCEPEDVVTNARAALRKASSERDKAMDAGATATAEATIATAASDAAVAAAQAAKEADDKGQRVGLNTFYRGDIYIDFLCKTLY
jgi:hypothetical protein